MTTEQNDSSKKIPFLNNFSISDALLLTLIPIFGYSVLFVYEWGYFRVFRLPLQFISFDIAEIFVASNNLVVLIGIVLFLINLIFKPYFNNRVPAPIRKYISAAIPIFASILALILIYLTMWKEVLPYIVALVILLLYFLLPPLISKKVKGNFLEKFVALEELEEKRHQKLQRGSLVDAILDAFNPKVEKALLIYIMFLFAAYHMGRGSALTNKTFRVINTDPEMVVLYAKADRVIASPFDRENKEVEPIYKVIYYDENPLEFKLESVGPLRFRREAISPIPSSTSTSTIKATPMPSGSSPESSPTNQLPVQTETALPEP